MNKSIKLIFNYLLAPVLFLLLTWSLYQQTIKQPDIGLRWDNISGSWKQFSFWIVVALMFLNWGLETKKWQILISPLEQFKFIKAFKSVLAGCSITMLTPNRIGEYGGRILYVQEENRLRAISLTILGSISQLLVTMMIGTTGLIVMRFIPEGDLLYSALPGLMGDVLLLISISATVILGLIYLRIKWLLDFLERFKVFKRVITHVRILDVFTGKQLLRIWLLSISRYIIFILQYLLMLNVMQVELSMLLCFWLLTIFYLVLAVAPTIGFIELPVRAAASVELFGLFSSNLLGIQAATFGIWLINLVIPAIAGSLLIFGIKILKDK